MLNSESGTEGGHLHLVCYADKGYSVDVGPQVDREGIAKVLQEACKGNDVILKKFDVSKTSDEYEAVVGVLLECGDGIPPSNKFDNLKVCADLFAIRSKSEI